MTFFPRNESTMFCGIEEQGFIVRNTFVEYPQDPMESPTSCRSPSAPPKLAHGFSGSSRFGLELEEALPVVKRILNRPMGFGFKPNSRTMDDASTAAGSSCHSTPNSTPASTPDPEQAKSPFIGFGKGRAAARPNARGQKGRSKPVQTVMVRNLPIRATIQQIFEHLDAYGFEQKYDYVHFPVDMRTRMHTGYAFVNMKSERDADLLVEALEGTQLAGSTSVKRIAVTPAIRQGLHANMHQLSKQGPKTRRAAIDMPWVRGCGGKMEQVWPDA